ncbi:MAG: RIP metalloprotease RseP [Cytophagales bacterium]|nr:RIP metalloprotease RseP [Cytophagales bacterium]
MDGLIMAAQMILGLSILVGVHEAGHMLAAKFFGMRVEQFAIGFPPKIFNFTWGETEYSLGAIPLGGFVKITGMIDESLDTEQMKKEPEPYEFRAKPAWQRLIVMLGGIIVNVITGVLIFIFLAYNNGESFLAKKELNKSGIFAGSLAKEIGFRTGDRVVAINGKDFQEFSDLTNPSFLLGDNSYYTVLRNGKEMQIDLPKGFINQLSSEKKRNEFISPLMTFKVGMVQKGSGADDAGLEKGDKILEVNHSATPYFYQFSELLHSNKGKLVDLLVLRNGKEKLLKAQVSENGTVGFQVDSQLKLSHRDYSFGQAIPAGTKRAFSVVWTNIKAFKKMFSGELDPRNSLSGPVKIAQQFGGEFNSTRFWTLTGLLSMVLAFMNLLPIPALDGGHVLFLTVEMVSGRALPEKFLEVAQKIGMVLLLALMVFVLANDAIQTWF